MQGSVFPKQTKCMVLNLDRSGVFVTTYCLLQIWKIDDQRYTENLDLVTCKKCLAQMQKTIDFPRRVFNG